MAEGVLIDPTGISPWGTDWLWSLPLIVVTVTIHSFGLSLINRRVSLVLDNDKKDRRVQIASALAMPATALYASVLHGLEGAIWAAAYLLLGAVPDKRSAMLYSLNAITSYGHTNIELKFHWQLMGSLESLNGWILFGLTTAFMFTVMQKVWPHFGRST